MDIGERVRELREEKGLSRQELASRVGISTTALYYIEKGKNTPSGAIVAKLAEALGVSADYLLGITDEPTPVWERAGLKPVKRGRLIPLYRPDMKQREGEIEIPHDVNGELAVRIESDALEPEIFKGDIVVVNRKLDIADNDRVLVIHSDPPKADVRIYKQTPDGVFLMSTNPKHPPILAEKAQFLAKIVCVMRRY